MSHVADVVLLDSGYNGYLIFNKVDDYLKERHGSGLVEVSEQGGGNKVMQCHVFCGAFNYLDIESFIKHLSSIKWDKREAIQVLIKDEHDEQFTLRSI